MSAQCSHFVQNAWKKELCSNCFKLREEHLEPSDTSRPLIKTPISVVSNKHKVQGILRIKEHCQVRLKKRNVGFQESLVELIGYGGDDFSDQEDDVQDLDSNDSSSPEDDVPDSEEERALGNLTRANTNFNTVTANLTVSATPEAKSAKTFASLMLGKVQKDADGNKKTLLVSVKPFGGDDSLPTAKRPSDKKVNNEYSRPKTLDIIPKDEKTEVSVKSIKKLVENENPITEKRPIESPSLEKIVDMPLITSSNLVAVIQNENLEAPSIQKSLDIIKSDKKISIARTPAIKKPENEKPRISIQNSYNKGEYAITKITKRTDIMNSENRTNGGYNSGVELTLTPLKKEPIEDRSILMKGKDINKISVPAAEEKKEPLILEERKVEGESTKFSFEESRESAGEPDGKADEDISEPPALPKNPPPLEQKLNRSSLPSEPKCLLSTAEPRSSFLHGESKIRPAVPQKPVSLPQKGSTSSISTIPKSNLSTFLAPNSVSTRGSPNEEIARTCNYSNSAINISETKKSDQILVQSCQNTSANVSLEEVPKLKEISPRTHAIPPRPKPPVLSLCKLLRAEEEPDDEEDTENSDSTSEVLRLSNKRRMAPKPPSTPTDDVPGSLFVRNTTSGTKSDSPVVREKEKRERASSCSPKFRKSVAASETPNLSDRAPEPAPRKNISLSQDSLANPERIEEKKKSRSRFSLKKFLRMGSRKDVDMTCGTGGTRMDEIPSTPQPKPRLEIIHPLELDGAAVQVLGNEGNSRVSEDVTDSKSNTSLISNSQANGILQVTARPGKPPPPPRNQSLEDWSRLDPANKPARPPPPRMDTKLPPRGEKPPLKTWQSSSNSSSTSDSIYANLGPAAAEDVTGEIRSALTPSKPQRTASMRDQANSQPPEKKTVHNPSQSQDYENLESNSTTSNSPTASESQVYECLSSSPECDSSLELRHGNGSHATGKRKSDSSALETNVEFKYHQPTFTRSTSLPYCGSETESELYAPYSFYTSDEGPEDDQDWKNKDDESRVSRLRQRRGRSIVHRSLEDNYGAVVVANHDALAQFLEQVNLISPLSLGLRGLKNANLRFSDFTLDSTSLVIVGRRLFYSATWNDHNVTICITFNPTMHVSKKEFYLAPIVEFIDAIPQEISDKIDCSGRKIIEATISVLPRLQVNTIHSFAAMEKDPKDEGTTKDFYFVLLQFVNAMKNLQARGIEEAPKNLSNVVLCREDKDACYRIYLLQGLNVDSGEECEEKMASLCQCALLALQELHLTNKLPLVKELLTKEKAETLSQVKSVLEFSLWGPADVTLGGLRERETALQRWLDLERANVLHALVRTRAPLTVTDEYHLLFLVHTTSKIMCEASIHLDKQRTGLLRTN